MNKLNIGNRVYENGEIRTIIEIVYGLIAGPHYRLSGYDHKPCEALTSHLLCSQHTAIETEEQRP